MLKKTLEVVKNTLETLSSMPHLSSRLWKIIILTLLKASIIVLFPLYIIKFSQVETILTNNTAVISFMLISASAALLLRTIPTIIDKLVMPIALYYYSQTTSNVAKQFYNLSIDNRLSNPVGEVTQSISANYAIIPSFIPPIFNNIIPVTIEGLLLLTLLTFFYGPISLVLIGLLSLQIFIATYFSSLIKKKENKHTEKIYDFYAALHPALNNYENAHLFNNDECEVKHLSQKLEDISQTYAQSYSAKKYTSLLVQFTLTAILFIVATYIAYSLSHGNLIISDIILIGIYGLLFLPEIEGFIPALTTLSTATSDIIKTNEFLSRSPSVREENNATSLNVNRESAVVEFKNVYFSHEQIPILNNVSFIAYPGEKIALVGLSGAGKSTIFKLLFRFYDVDSGTIKINQQDIKQVTLQSLRSSISVVPQDTILFTGTLKENIQYGNLQANEEELINATQQAELTELIQTRGGLDVSIGEEGLKLSGGQRQRISIARALLKKGVIYLFDEATSSLDPTTSMSIQKTLDKISKNHTTLFITHDLLTVTNADKIIFLDPTGKISEIGTFTELVKQESNFYKYMLNYCQSSGIELSQLIKKRNLVNSAV